MFLNTVVILMSFVAHVMLTVFFFLLLILINDFILYKAIVKHVALIAVNRLYKLPIVVAAVVLLLSDRKKQVLSLT